MPLVEGRERVGIPRLSPDGAWVLYTEPPMNDASHPRRRRLMRVAVNGGLPEVVFETARLDDYQCARAPESFCVAVEASQDEKRYSVTAFDPLRGKGKLLRTIENAKEVRGSNLSPDGSTLAVARGDDPDIHISLLSLSGRLDREIVVKGWPSLAGLDWAADGKGLYVGSTSSQGGTLLHVDLKGAARILWRSREAGVDTFLAALPSPDGRYLALGGAVRDSNVWMVEGF